MEKNKKLKARYFLYPFFAVLLILTLITIFYFKNLDSNRWFTHTQNVKFSIQNVFNTFRDAEIGQRGYIITQDTAYLQPYIKAKENFQEAINLTSKLVQNNPTQLLRLDTIKSLGALHFEELEHTIELIKKGDVIAAITIVRKDLGKSYMDKLRSLSDKMNKDENSRLLEHYQDLKFWRNLIIVIIVISLLIIGFSLLHLYKTIKPIFDELTKTKNQLKNVNDNLAESLYNIKKLDHEKLLEIEAKENITHKNEQLINQLLSRNLKLESLIIELNEAQRIYASKPSEEVPEYVIKIHKIIEKMKFSIEDFTKNNEGN